VILDTAATVATYDARAAFGKGPAPVESHRA
jgi:hypothetical protein